MNFNDLHNLFVECRSTRRFIHDVSVPGQDLHDLVEIARLTASSKNQQPLKYILINDRKRCADVFGCLGWAKALSKWSGPEETERPAAYIIILGDSSVGNSLSMVGAKYSVDPGIVAQSLMLGARAKGLGGCIIASIDRDKLRESFKIEKKFDILLIATIGKPGEKIFIDPMPANGSPNYWRDEDDNHHVPKRSAEELVVSEYISE